MITLAFEGVAAGHTHGGRDTRAGVADAEQVEWRFAGLGEARHPTRLPKGRQLVGASGEKFVGIALVSDIEQQPVVFEVEDPMQGHGQFDHTKVRSQVSTGGHHLADDGLANFLGKSGQLLRRKSAKISGASNGGQKRSRHAEILGLEGA